jgi:hypothetical protein
LATAFFRGVVIAMASASAPRFVSVLPQAATRGPRHHFFGYYDKSPWDYSGRWLLAQETPFMDRPPTENDILTIGLIDTSRENSWIPLAETRAWNWQQGCMLQWLDGGRSNKIIFNDRRGDRLVSRILDTSSGVEVVLDRPVYGVNPAGTHAVSLNFARLHHQRPGYGYPGLTDLWLNDAEPKDDGLHLLDLATGNSQFILSVAQAAQWRRLPEMDGPVHRFNHVQFSPGGRRFACLHRWKTPQQEVGHTRLLTLNTDGSGLCCLADDRLVSHYDWRDEHRVLAWARQESEDHYFLFEENTESALAIAPSVLTCDGHCSFSPDRKWVLTDTYPDATHHRTLLLYHWASGERIDIGQFHAPPMDWQIRCDLHPRWSHDGTKICIDSIHEGSRQMYILDVSSLVKNS